MKPGERLAVIDLGSNSFRLVVFMAGEGWWKRTDEIYEPVRIGEGLVAERASSGASRWHGRWPRSTCSRSSAHASGLEPNAIDAVATSAIRDADNAEDFLNDARARSRLPIRVLSRDAEARYGYLAAVNSTTLSDGCVLDLGGGSLQLVHVRDRLALRVRLLARGHGAHERALPARQRPGQARASSRRLREHVAEQLAQADWLQRR